MIITVSKVLVDLETRISELMPSCAIEVDWITVPVIQSTSTLLGRARLWWILLLALWLFFIKDVATTQSKHI